MPYRSGPYIGTSKGTYDTKKKTFSGKGAGPPGYKKVPEVDPADVPYTTVSSSGKITTSGYSSPRAATRARKQARAARRTVRRQSQALKLSRQKPPSTARRSDTSESKARLKGTERAVKADSQRVRTAPKFSPAPKPSSKPPRFEGRKTAGTPTQRQLLRAKRAGTLKVNQRGYLTTPVVRKTTRTIKNIERKAAKRRSRSPLPGLDREQTHVARTVLRRGEKARATSIEKLAAVETGLVESSLRNLSYGDADSKGFRQERTSIYGDGPQGPTNVRASADRLYRELRTDAGTSSAAAPGLLAQAAQGSAFPERYDEREPEARAIIHAYNKGKLKPKEQRKLSKARRKAADLGLKGLTKSKPGPAPKKVVTRYKAIKASAKALERMKVPYVYGGGHGTGTPNPSGGLDCSSSTVYLLNKAGVKVPNITSGEFGNHFPSGPGAVTIFYNAGHVFLRIGEDYYGTSVGDSGAGGLGYHPAPSEGYLSQYSVAHVPGLGKKQALQLGISPATPTSFPGMSLSPGGTTATIESGAATTKGEAGFSSKPIRLTQSQKARRTYRRLRKAGVGTEEAVSAESETSPTLQVLEERYGVKTG